MSDFLPPSYEKPASNSKYYKFQQGENRFRILSPAITGWIDWDNKQPVRTKERPEVSIDPTKPVKHFWTFIIWDYREKAVKILELTQSTIQDAIYSLYSDKDWGNPTGYDINVKKTGEKMETKYNVVPTPPRAMATDIIELYKSLNINLQELYRGGDPFDTKDAPMPESFLQDETPPLTDGQMASIS